MSFFTILVINECTKYKYFHLDMSQQVISFFSGRDSWVSPRAELPVSLRNYVGFTP